MSQVPTPSQTQTPGGFQGAAVASITLRTGGTPPVWTLATAAAVASAVQAGAAAVAPTAASTGLTASVQSITTVNGGTILYSGGDSNGGSQRRALRAIFRAAAATPTSPGAASLASVQLLGFGSPGASAAFAAAVGSNAASFNGAASASLSASIPGVSVSLNSMGSTLVAVPVTPSVTPPPITESGIAVSPHGGRLCAEFAALPSSLCRPFSRKRSQASFSGTRLLATPRVLSNTLLQSSSAAVRLPAAAAKALRATGFAAGGITQTDASSASMSPLISIAAAQAASGAAGQQLFAPSCGSALDAWAAGGSSSSADVAGSLAARTSAGEPVVLLADVLLQTAPARDGSFFFIRPVLVDAQVGSLLFLVEYHRQTSPPLFPPVQTLWLPYSKTGSGWPLGDGRLALYDALAALTRVAPATQRAALAVPTGFVLAVTSVAWTLVGCPSSTLANATSGDATVATKCGAYVSAPNAAHVLSLQSAALALDVGSLLRAGHVYRVSVAVQLNVSVAWAGSPFFSGASAAGQQRLVSAAPLGPVAAAVAELSARLASGRARLSPLRLAAPASHALLVATHSPPLFGAVAVTPASGTSLGTPFNLSTAGWAVSAAAEESSALYPSGRLPALSASAASAWLAATIPLSDSATCDAARAAAALGSPLALPSPVCEISVATLSAGNAAAAGAIPKTILNTTDAPAALTTPAWLLQLALASAVGNLGGGLTPDAALSLLCGTARDFASRATASNASRLVSAVGTPAAPLQLQFRAALSGRAHPSLPLLASGVADAAGVSASQPVLRSSATWPGIPLAALSPASTIASILVSTNASSATSTLVSLPIIVGNVSTPVGVYVFAVDELGAVGVAFATALVTPPLTRAQSVDAALVNAFTTRLANSSLTSDAVSADPYGSLFAAAAVGAAYSGLSEAGASNGTGSADGDALKVRRTLGQGKWLGVVTLLCHSQASNSATRSTAVAAVGGAITAITGAGNASTGGGGGGSLDDATLGLIAGTLSALTADPTELDGDTGLAAAAAATAALAASAPSNSSGSLAAAPTTFPLIIGNAVLDTLVNIKAAAVATGNASSSSVGASVSSNVSTALLSTVSALTTASLRGSSSVDSNSSSRSMTGGPTAAFSSPSYCGPSLSVTVTRVSAAGAAVQTVSSSTAATTVSVVTPAVPCIPGTSSAIDTQQQESPQVTLPASTIAAALANSSSPAVDVAVVQWGNSPYPEQQGWSGQPASLTPTGLGSHVLSVILQASLRARSSHEGLHSPLPVLRGADAGGRRPVPPVPARVRPGAWCCCLAHDAGLVSGAPLHALPPT